jgi:hypothetical protein
MPAENCNEEMPQSLHSTDETDLSTDTIQHKNTEQQDSSHVGSTADQGHPSSDESTSNPCMTAQETAWWAMTFDELYQYARTKNFGKSGKEGRKSGRIRIIKWLCEKEGITPWVAPSVTPIETPSLITSLNVRLSKAISHPEAILRTSDPKLQALIDVAEIEYKTWVAADLVALAMKRSYQLLKDSNGKLPSKSISALVQWLAAWDILKSPREKEWWLGDGIDLVNKAKAMGYQGSSKKYDVIVWLRSTPEEAELVVNNIADATPNKKRKPGQAPLKVSKRPAKGSKRPNGWHKTSNFDD